MQGYLKIRIGKTQDWNNVFLDNRTKEDWNNVIASRSQGRKKWTKTVEMTGWRKHVKNTRKSRGIDTNILQSHRKSSYGAIAA